MASDHSRKCPCRFLARAGTCILLLLCTPAAAAPPAKVDIPADLPPDLKQLIEQTFSDDLLQRATAVQKLGEMGNRAVPAIPFIIRLADDSGVQGVGEGNYYADKALVKIGDPALDACIAATRDSSKEISFGVIHALGMFNSDRAIDRLLQLLTSIVLPDKVHDSAILALIGTTDPRATMPLVDRLENEKGYTSVWAAECFKTIRDERAVKPLLKCLKWQPWGSDRTWNDSRRHDVIQALGFQRDHHANLDLKAILADPKESEWIRADAAYSLGQISTRDINKTLADVLQDRTLPSVIRAGAARGIGAYWPQLQDPEFGKMDEARDDARMLFCSAKFS